MAVQRPTFSESWYRVADLRPRLRTGVQISRQHFRGRLWHVLRDPSNNQYFRVSEPAYYFLAMLDGRRTVSEAWQLSNEKQGDDAPTQGEAIQLLGQLYTSNLLYSELPPDAEGLFARYRKRKTREVQGVLMNLLFIRIPLIDPDRFLNTWCGIFGRLFSTPGFMLWLALLACGFYFIIGRLSQLSDSAQGILNQENLPLLYGAFVLVKIFHEFGHAFSCKRFGRVEGGAGEVHEMGVMFLVFAPMPYVDASSSWAFRSKWRRIIVGAGGMIVELAIAAIAAIVWANTTRGSAINAVCYNVMFIASVSTLLFNGNPLLRYDAYYMLSDLLEIPNLAQRSRNYLYYLVRRYVWGVKHVQNPAHTQGEKWWLSFYGVSSMIYRVFICVGILLFVADKLFLVGAVLAVAAVIAWVVIPLGKFIHYLATSSELMRVRPRAVGTTAGFTLLLVAGLGFIPAPDYCRAEGIVEPARFATIYALEDGFVQFVLASDQSVAPETSVLVRATNDELESRRDELDAEYRRLLVEQRVRREKEQAEAQILAEQIVALERQRKRVNEELANLTIRPPLAGTWVVDDPRRLIGSYLRRGDPVGLVADLDRISIRAMAGQDLAARLILEGQENVEIRVKGQPNVEVGGKVLKIHPAGEDKLPSAAMSYAVGGAFETEQDDKSGTRTSERFFEIQIARDEKTPGHKLLPGQRVVVRMRMKDKPYAFQAWTAILQLIQRRFHA